MRQQSQQEETAQTLPHALTPTVEEARLPATTTAEVASAETDLTAGKIKKLLTVNRRRKRVMRWIGLPIAGVVTTITLLRAIIFIQGNPNSLYAHALLGLLVANYLWFVAILPGILEAVEALSSRLRQIARLRWRNLKVTAAGALGGTALACISLANGGNPTSPLLLAGLLSSLGIMGLFIARDLYTQRNLMQALIHTDDLSCVGPLVEAAASSEISGAIAAMALTPLLSRLQASDASLLDGHSRDHLYRALMLHRGNTEFVLAALLALQQIGDGKAIPVVQKLAERVGRNAAGQSIREAALACLPFLELRAAQDQASQMLLRASAANATLPDTLLRPVQETPPTVATELLRPGTPPPDTDGANGTDDVQQNLTFSNIFASISVNPALA